MKTRRAFCFTIVVLDGILQPANLVSHCSDRMQSHTPHPRKSVAEGDPTLAGPVNAFAIRIPSVATLSTELVQLPLVLPFAIAALPVICLDFRFGIGRFAVARHD